MFHGSEGSKSRLATAASAEPPGGRRDQKLHAVVARRRFGGRVKMLKTPHSHAHTFRSWYVQKVRAAVAQSTFTSQKASKASKADGLGQLLDVEMSKSKHCCGAKHILKWKVLSTNGLGTLLEVEMSKKCGPLNRKAHSQINKVKNWRSRTTFGRWDAEKVDAVVVQSTFRSERCQELTVLGHFWELRCRKSAAAVARSTFASQKCQKLTVSDHFWKLRCCTQLQLQLQPQQNCNCNCNSG